MEYRICPYCKARLDPGERCDCRDGMQPQEGTDMAGENEHIDNDHNKKEEHIHGGN